MITVRLRPLVDHPSSTTIFLEPSSSGYDAVVVRTDEQGKEPARSVVQLAAQAVERQLMLLYGLHVPLFVTHPTDAVGEAVELLVDGERGRVSVAWWGTAPRGCANVQSFVRWLREAARCAPSTHEPHMDFDNGAEP